MIKKMTSLAYENIKNKSKGIVDKKFYLKYMVSKENDW